MASFWVWALFIFQAFIGILITLITNFFTYMRAKGKLGGGKMVMNLSALPHGKVSFFNIASQHGMYGVDAGGGDIRITKIHGLFAGREDVTIPKDELIPLDGDNFLYGREALGRLLDRYVRDFQRQLDMMMNDYSVVIRELKKERTDKNKLIDEMTAHMEKFRDASIAWSKGGKK